jgi:Pentapeptide repeats (9 copies)
MKEILTNYKDIIIAVLGFITASIGILKFFNFRTKSQKLAYVKDSFETIVKELSSRNEISKVSSAILLRRFFDKKSEFGVGSTPYKKEAINVIASILRSTPTGLFQKTLADSLAYAGDLKHADLQKANLQNAFLGKKENRLVDLTNADFFQANLSKASLNGAIAQNAVFYKASLVNTVFKNSNLESANFQESDLTGANFKNAKLAGATFRNAINIPSDIFDKLDNDWVYLDNIDNIKRPEKKQNLKKVFISSPSSLNFEQRGLYDFIFKKLTEDGFEIIRIAPNNYSTFGQISEVKKQITNCSAVVCFGFNNFLVNEGLSKANTDQKENIKNQWLTTPWIQIEVGMAVMLNIPILLIKDEVQDGIFDPKISENSFYVLDKSKIQEEETFKNVYNEWKNDIIN